MTDLRRLIDYPSIEELERQSYLRPELMAEAAAQNPESGIEDVVAKVFNVGGDDTAYFDFLDVEIPESGELEETPYDRLIDEIESGSPVEVFAKHGWDVTDGRGKPLRLLEHYIGPLAWAITRPDGVIMKPPLADPEDWGAALLRDDKPKPPTKP